jgi:hypothetical protein
VDEFEYITVLLSILIGLGISQLLGGIARLVRDGRALAPAWWVLLVVSTLLVAHVQVWWVSFGWRHVAEWTFFSYLAFLVVPVLLYLLAFLVLPPDLHVDGKGLAQEFIRRRRPFYTIVALIPPASFLQQWMLAGGTPPLDIDTGIRLAWLAMAIPGIISPRVRVQATLAAAYLVLMIVYISLLFVRIA